MTEAELRTLIESPESTRLEFKSASGNFEFESLAKYCVALANEGGGTLVLGVTDKRPRRVVGTRAFKEPGRTAAVLYQKLGHRVELEEHRYEGKRVLVVQVPSRLPGTAWHYNGAYLMRAGDALVPMPDEQLRRIHLENVPDFSAQICQEARLADLHPDAINTLRRLWQRQATRQDIASRPAERLLTDAELLVDGGVTYAALILLGTTDALSRHLAQAEVVFEYRPSDAPGKAADRREFRCGFFLIMEQLWQIINLRNDLQHFQHGLFVWDVPTFDERAVRELILNAVAHRDYRHGGSVFVRQYPRRIEFVSPGGFPPGINAGNVLWEQNPRNRRIAEVMGKCGLVERAGQGFDLIYRACIQQSKPLPDFSRTSEHSVWVTLHGEIQDLDFLRFFEELGRERLDTFSIEDFLIVDLVHREEPIPAYLNARLPRLLEQGVIERVGRGRGVKYFLSRQFYRFLGKAGVYTRQRGLDRETNKALLWRHIENSAAGGAAFAELQQVLPGLSRNQIQSLLRELKREGRVVARGATKGARWFPAGPRRNATQ